MRRLRRLWRLFIYWRGRRLRRRDSDPNFLFSLPPYVDWGEGPPRIVVVPSGGDDTAPMQAAVNRLTSIDGGMLRLSAGDYFASPIFIPENLVDDKPL